MKATERSDGRWMVNVRDPNTNKRVPIYGKTELECLRNAKRKLAVADTSSLWNYYTTVYLPSIEHTSRSWQDQTQSAMLYILPAVGHLPLDEIDRPRMQRIFSDMAALKNGSGKRKGQRRLSDGTLAKYKIAVSAVFNLALTDELISKNPCTKVKLNPPQIVDLRTLSAWELRCVLEASSGAVRKAILLQGLCGLRVGETCGMEKRHLTASCIYPQQQVIYEQGGAELSPKLKTPHSRAIVPIPQPVFRQLMEGRSTFVVEGTDGPFALPKYLNDQYAELAKKVKIEPFTSHALRRAFCTILESELEAPASIVAALARKAKKGNLASYVCPEASRRRAWMEKLHHYVSTASEQILTTDLTTGSGAEPRKNAG